MTPPTTFRASLRQRGIAALELAIILPVLIAMLAGVLFYSRYCWHYGVLQKAARDGALLVAEAPRLEMTKLTPVGQVAPVALAVTIMQREMADLNPGGQTIQPHVMCQIQLTASPSSVTWGQCNGTSLPLQVKTSIFMYMTDPFFGLFTAIGGDTGLMVAADVTVPYVGN